MANTFPPRVGTVFAERYQLRESLGSGGVGQVFRAWDVQAQRLVAIKSINPAGVSPTTWAAYVAVVEAAAPVRHPDLVLPQGLPPALPPLPFGVMESLVGEDLATMRARMGHVPWQRAVEIGARCAEILHAVIGATGIGHRDLKASNIFVTESGAVKLLDYGVAEFDVQSPDRTRVDSALGVVDYKAPEQLEANIGSLHADVFSLAVLIFEMIAGERPFAGASYFIVARKILLDPAPLLSEVAPAAGVPAALDALLQRALAKRPGDRFVDLQAMQKALQDALRGTPRGARGPGRQAPATSPPQPVRPAPRPADVTEEDEETMLAPPRMGGRKPGIRPPTGQIKQVVPSGAKAVVVAAAGESLADVNNVQRTVVGGVGSSPLAQQRGAALRGSVPLRTVADGVVATRPSTRPPNRPPSRAVIHPHEPAPDFAEHGRDDGAQPERTMILGDANVPRAEATLMLPGDAPPERTMMLPDDGPRPERTMMMPDDGPSQSPEGTMQLAGEAPTTRDGWPLQRILIVINVACGLLILIGLLVLVLGGGADTPPSLEK